MEAKKYKLKRQKSQNSQEWQIGFLNACHEIKFDEL